MQNIIEPYGDNFIPVIPVEDGVLHTSTNPFCFIDPACSCHEDQSLIQVVAEYVHHGLMTPTEATDFVAGKMI